MSKNRLSRRDFFKMSAVTAASVAGAGLLACGSKVGDRLHSDGFDAGLYEGVKRIAPESVIRKLPGFTGRRPNIITILCDDLGWGDLGCYGNRAIRTPNVDGLARQGVRFTNFYSSCSVCTPSRYGLLSGRYPVRSGLIFVMPASNESLMRKTIRTMGRWLGGFGATDVQDDCWTDGLPDDEITLAGALKVAGYRTGMVGKWHLGDFSANPAFNPRRHGFDSFFGVPHSNDMWPCALYRDEKMLEPDIKLNQARLTGHVHEGGDRLHREIEGRALLPLPGPHLPAPAPVRVREVQGQIEGRHIRRRGRGDRLERGRDHEVPAAERARGQHHHPVHQRQRPLVQREPRLASAAGRDRATRAGTACPLS